MGSLGALSQLSSLDLGGNAIGDDGIDALVPAFPLLARSLQRLCLSDSYIGTEGATALGTALPALTALQALDLDGSLEGGLVSELAPCLAQLTTLTLLSLGRNRFNEAGLAALVPCLAQLTALQHLGLWGCFLGARGASPLLPSLGAALGKLVSLTQLEMSSNDLFDTGAAALASGLLHLTALRHLEIAHNGFGEAGLDSLAPALARMPALRCLDLGDNLVNDAGAVALARHLSRCSGLEQLNLQGIGVGAEGATALSGLLREHLRSLQHLSLRGCSQMGSAGVFSLAGALRGLVSVRNLDLSKVCNNTHPDGPDAACALAAALAGLTGITRLNLGENAGFGEAGAVALADSLRGLTRLQFLDYSRCCAGAGGLAALCLSLRGLSRLQHLDLASNLRGGDCSGVATTLGLTLPSLTALTLLDLCHNNLDERVAAALASGIIGLSRLRQLKLHQNCFGDGGVALLGNSIKVGWCYTVCASARSWTNAKFASAL